MMMQVGAHDIYAVTAGSAQDPGLILLHGAGMDHSFWRYFPRALAAKGYFVVAPDLPAHGRSSGDLLTSVESMSVWVQSLAEVTGMKSFALAGHSMGSLVALQTAANAGPDCRALALVGNAYPMKVGQPLLSAAKSGDPSIHTLTTLFGTTQSTRFYGAFPAGSSQLNLRLSQQYHERPGVLHNDLTACNQYRAGEIAAEGVSAPTLFVSGDEDRMTPVTATATLRQLMPQSDLTVLQGCAHQHTFEQPKALLDALANFLDRAHQPVTTQI